MVKIPTKAPAAIGRALSADLTDQSLAVDLCLASFTRGAESANVQQVPITKALAGILRGALDETLRAKAAAWNERNLELKPYVPLVHLGPQDIEVLDLTAFPAMQAEVSVLSSIAALPGFESDETFIVGLRYSVVVLHVPDGPPVCVFRAMNAKRELQRSRWLGIVLRGGAFQALSDEVYLLDLGIDCISCGDLLFIFQKGNFQTIFRFFDEIRRTARETLEVLRQRDLIEGFEAFEQACLGHVQMAAKLHSAATATYFPALTVKRMKAVAKQFGRKIRFRQSNGRERAVFDADDKWELLRLLDDDLLASPLTKLKYEVNSKRVV